ncbi:MAG: hypothetical protein AABW79_04520 [Nanoarchaeota archaeon]
MNERSEKGRKGRVNGRIFELKVRKDLEKKGWVVAKWSNNVELNEEDGELIPAKRKYNPFTKFASFGNGFPDFITYKLLESGSYEVIGVEVKSRGYLDKEERIKCSWLLKNKIFNSVSIAKKGKQRGEIIYDKFNTG